MPARWDLVFVFKCDLVFVCVILFVLAQTGPAPIQHHRHYITCKLLEVELGWTGEESDSKMAIKGSITPRVVNW